MAKILSLTAQKDPKCSFNGPIIKPFAVKAFGLDRKGRREAASIPYPPTPPQTAATALRLSSITLNVRGNGVMSEHWESLTRIIRDFYNQNF